MTASEALNRVASRCAAKGFTVKEFTPNAVTCTRPINAVAGFFAALMLGRSTPDGYTEYLRYIAFGTPELLTLQFTDTAEGVGYGGQVSAMPIGEDGKDGLEAAMRETFPEAR